MLIYQKLNHFLLVVLINLVQRAFAQGTDNTDPTILQPDTMYLIPIQPLKFDPNDCYWAGSGPICIGWCRSDEYVAASSRRGRGIECLAGFQRLCCKIRPVTPTVPSTTFLPSTITIANNSPAVLPIVPLEQRRSCYWIGEAPTCDSWCQAGEYVAAASRKGIDGLECEIGLKKYCCPMVHRRVTPPPINIVIVNNTAWSLASFAPTTEAAQAIKPNTDKSNVVPTSQPAKSPVDLMASIMASVNPLFEAAMNKTSEPSNSSIPAIQSNMPSLMTDFSSTQLPATSSDIPLMTLSTTMPSDISNMSSAFLLTTPVSIMPIPTSTPLSSSSLPLFSTGGDSTVSSSLSTEMLTSTSNFVPVFQSSTANPVESSSFTTNLLSTTQLPLENLASTQSPTTVTSLTPETSTSSMLPVTLNSTTTLSLLIPSAIASATANFTTTMQPPTSTAAKWVSTPKEQAELQATSSLPSSNNSFIMSSLDNNSMVTTSTPEVTTTTTTTPLVPVTLQTAISSATEYPLTTTTTVELTLSTLSTVLTRPSSIFLPLITTNLTTTSAPTTTRDLTTTATPNSNAISQGPTFLLATTSTPMSVSISSTSSDQLVEVTKTTSNSLANANMSQTVANLSWWNINSTPVTTKEDPSTKSSLSDPPPTTQSPNSKPSIILASKIQTKNDSFNMTSNGTLSALTLKDFSSDPLMSNPPIIIPNYLKRNCKKNTSTTPSPNLTSMPIIQTVASEMKNQPMNLSKDGDITEKGVTISSSSSSIPFDVPN